MHENCIVVHAGAGYHSKHKETEYIQLCSDACLRAAAILTQDNSKFRSINAACEAVAFLEDNHLSNAGYGSNLTLDGSVECDAGVMCGSCLRFAAVGSLSCIKNPILVAGHLLSQQIMDPFSRLGRVFPSLLVGKGALDYAVNAAGFSRIQEVEMISPSSLASWKKYKNWIDHVDKDTCHSMSLHHVSSKKARFMTPLDTVGAVCVDSFGRVASAISSGGVAMKSPGRLGQACIYSAGSWAECSPEEDGKVTESVGVITSGTGEQLIRTQLAQKCAQRVINDTLPVPLAVEASLSTDFLNSRFLNGEPDQRFAGVAGCLWRSLPFVRKRRSSEACVEIFFGHTTQSMAVAYFVDNTMKIPKSFISRKPLGRRHLVGAFSHRLLSC
ncbi:unnamed protein product [Protopolystoma xenopodis]|uniref:Threonine aspartase 1 n=1 Tax=Protopolystoma xenopodis TaxID=117903 RepID=A0A448WZR0_9PLAT|nr:unnamed protein product [Protopolystoma xenopodis]